MDPARRAFLVLKPDAVQQGLVQDVVAWLEIRHFTPVSAHLLHLTPDLRSELYATKRSGGVLDWGLNSILYTLGPVLAIVLDGDTGGHSSAAYRLTSLKGDYRPNQASPGTLRAEIGALNPIFNAVHTSDNSVEVDREVKAILGSNWSASLDELMKQRARPSSQFSIWSALSECLDALFSTWDGVPGSRTPKFANSNAWSDAPRSTTTPSSMSLTQLREAVHAHCATFAGEVGELVMGVSRGETNWDTWLSSLRNAKSKRHLLGSISETEVGSLWVPYLAFTTLRYLDLSLEGAS